MSIMTGEGARATTKAPFRHVDFRPPEVEVERRSDGTMVLRSPIPLGSYERNVVAYLRRAAERVPERVFLAERGPDRNWIRVTYGEMRRRVDAVAASLLARGLGPERPAMILSGNGIDHAVLMLACLTAGVPVAPVSVAYSLMSRDHAKLRHVFALVEPKLIFAASGRMFAGALAALDLSGVELVVSADPPTGMKATSFGELLAGKTGAEVEAAYAATGPDTVAKILFTSGSTGLPKGVINTQRMLCANQRMSELVVLSDPDEPPVLLDWLPWNHTFGGNYNFNLVMRQGGTMHIDAGRPLPGLFDQTIANLREISPTQYSNVPAGFAMLAPELEADPALRETFFRDLKVLAYGGASLPNELWEHYQDLAERTLGERIAFISGWGSTETAPTATSVHWPAERSGIIGLPFPGVELKMVPVGETYELRVRGETVTPGYLRRPDLTAAAFDEEGFYKIGDAGRLADPQDPAQGLMFDGRVVEDFKLASGTFVHVGGVRVGVLGALQPALQDLAVAGHDRPYIALLAWPNLAACKEICRAAGDAAAAEGPVPMLLASPALIGHLRQGLARYNEGAGGSSARVARLLLMAEPPSIDGNEITDKGYINQLATLTRRADLVRRLYSDPPAADVIVA